MNLTNVKGNFDRREESREICSGSVFYEYRKLLFKAELKNYSPSGLFIKANDFFLAGETINVAIPKSDYKDDKYKGRIIWCNQEGCGVFLLGAL